MNNHHENYPLPLSKVRELVKDMIDKGYDVERLLRGTVCDNHGLWVPKLVKPCKRLGV